MFTREFILYLSLFIVLISLTYIEAGESDTLKQEGIDQVFFALRENTNAAYDESKYPLIVVDTSVAVQVLLSSTPIHKPDVFVDNQPAEYPSLTLVFMKKYFIVFYKEAGEGIVYRTIHLYDPNKSGKNDEEYR
jgi:hypothetical protein